VDGLEGGLKVDESFSSVSVVVDDDSLSSGDVPELRLPEAVAAAAAPVAVVATVRSFPFLLFPPENKS